MQKNIKIEKTSQQTPETKQWMQISLNVQDQLAQLPPWAQEILCDDIVTAINSRIAVFKNTATTA